MHEIFDSYAEVDPDSGEPSLNSKSWERLCKAEKLWQAGDRGLVEEFYSKRNSKKQNLPASFEELIKEWDLKYRPRLQLLLERIEHEPITIYFERINNSILLNEKGSQQKIWMNYKLLEAEIERIDAYQFISDNFWGNHLRSLDFSCESFV